MQLVALAIGWLLALVPALVAKIILALGVGVVSYTGMSALLNNLQSAVMNNAGSVSADVAAYLGLAGVDTCISMMMSALSIRLTLLTVNGVINKVTFTNKALPS